MVWKVKYMDTKIEKHTKNCLCIICKKHPCEDGCNDKYCVTDCMFYSKKEVGVSSNAKTSFGLHGDQLKMVGKNRPPLPK